MEQILRQLALVTARRWTAALLLAVLVSAGCGGEDETAEADRETGEMQTVELSRFIQPRDSLRWLDYMEFAPQDTALSYVMMAALYLANEYPRPALHYLRLAQDHDLDRPIIYLNRGYAYNMMGDYDRAAESFRLFVQRDPGSILSQEIFRIVEKYQAITSRPPAR